MWNWEVTVEFVGQLAIAALPGEHACEASEQAAQRGHYDSRPARGSGPGFRWSVPTRGLRFRVVCGGARQLVIFGFAIVVGDAPFGSDVALLLEFQQRGIQRPVINRKQVTASLLDAAGDTVTVKRAHGLQRFQNHQGQSSLPDVFFVGHCLFASSYGKAIAQDAITRMGKQ